VKDYQPAKQMVQAPTIEAPTRPNTFPNYPSLGTPLSRMSSNSEKSLGLKSEKKKIGILGLGSIGSRHYRNFKELGCEVLGYDSHRPANAFDRQYVINWADAIAVATPTEQHGNDIIDCLVAQKPMFVEKPIHGANAALSDGDLGILMVGYNLRFHSCVKKAKEWMGIGKIGKPLWARFTCAQFNNKPDYLRDGVILNWSHEIDLALYLLGDAKLVAGSHNTEESLADLCLYHSTINCHTMVHLDYLTKHERRGFLIVGEYGAIEADLVKRELYHKNNLGHNADSFYGRDSFDGNYITEAQAFLDRLEGKEALGCTAEEAMAVVKICLEAKRCGQ